MCYNITKLYLKKGGQIVANGDYEVTHNRILNSGKKIFKEQGFEKANLRACLLYTSPSPRDLSTSRMPSSA